jgi:hypothetical protein
MRVVEVDERDAGCKGPNPKFRVYLHGSGEAETYGWTDTYDITGRTSSKASTGHRSRPADG